MINVKVLSIKGCEAAGPTVELVRSVAREIDIEIDLELLVIETPEQAKEFRLIGSPTVQVNNLDIEPSSRQDNLFGVT